jgi:acyl-CoA synthetase (AMP-forming)/AMP-acid ligase II
VAAAWHHDPHHPLYPGEFAGILGFTSSDYTTLDLACVRLGAVCVPLQSSASAGHLKPIIAETGPRLLASSVELLDTAVEAALDSRSLQAPVVFSPPRPPPPRGGGPPPGWGPRHPQHRHARSDQATESGVSRTETVAWLSWKLCSETTVSRAVDWNSGIVTAPQETIVDFILATVTARPSLRSPA